ncbi:MAG TPA: DUF4410 domain-containing protein, partial [Verrucomicrobiae bacterium]|nr:DUF4410 domain-containing protein [Verrucomicrobiae bacterium]
MKKIVLILLAAVAFGAAGAGAAEEKPLPKPDVLTEESVSTSQRLSSYDTIIIRDFKIDKAELSNIDAEEKVKVDNMRPMLARTVTDGLELELKNRKLFKNIEKNTEPKGKAVIVEGEFTEINGGNRAIRFWVGFGAGKTYLKV